MAKIFTFIFSCCFFFYHFLIFLFLFSLRFHSISFFSGPIENEMLLVLSLFFFVFLTKTPFFILRVFAMYEASPKTDTFEMIENIISIMAPALPFQPIQIQRFCIFPVDDLQACLHRIYSSKRRKQGIYACNLLHLSLVCLRSRIVMH